MADNTTLQIRISVDDKRKIKQLAKEKGYKDTTEYIIDFCCNDNRQSCNDNVSENLSHDNYFRLYNDLLSEYNYFKNLLDSRISIFDSDFSYWDLGSFLWNVDFIEKFKDQYFSEWKKCDSFDILLTQLKKVYHLAYDAEQEKSIRLNGYIEKSLGNEYRAIPNEIYLLEKEV